MDGLREEGDIFYSMGSAVRGGREEWKERGQEECLPASGDSTVTSVASPSPAEVEADTDTL